MIPAYTSDVPAQVISSSFPLVLPILVPATKAIPSQQVIIFNDSEIEGDEFLFAAVRVIDADGREVVTGTGLDLQIETGTIVDDDDLPTVSIVGRSVLEDEASESNSPLRLELEHAIDDDVTVLVSTPNTSIRVGEGIAEPGKDYAPLNRFPVTINLIPPVLSKSYEPIEKTPCALYDNDFDQ